MQRIRFGATTFVLAAVVVASFAVTAIAQSPHFVMTRTPTCTQSTTDNTIAVNCTGGKISGVGTQPAQVGIDVPGGCVNKGNQNPPGHVQSESQPITPKGGNIVFGPLTATVSCPPGLTSVVGPTVTYFIVENGQTTTIGTVPIT